MPLAIAAALALHLLVIVGGQVGARPSAPSGLTASMTVRFVEAVAAAKPVQVVDAQERSNAVDARQPAPAAERPSAVAGPYKPRAASAVVAAAPLPRPEPLAARPPPAAQPAAPALPPAPAYLLGANLDVGPQPIGDIEPEYPESANLQEGKVVVRVLINEAGSVDNVAVVRSAPAGLFDPSALEAFAKAQFSPGRAGGVPVKSQITVEVHFLPINRGSRISGRGY